MRRGRPILPSSASRRRVVLGAAFDPAFAGGGVLAFPERRVGLQPVDEEMAGGERRLAVWRGRRHQHDAVARFEPAVAVDDEARIERPAPVRLGLDLFKLLLGHAGVVFEGQRLDPVGTAEIAHQPDKAGDPADARVAGSEAVEFGADVEILALHADHRSNPPSPAGRSRPRRRRAPGARVRHNPG